MIINNKYKLGIMILKVKVAAKGVGMVLKRPNYFAGAFIVAFFVANIIIWSLNLELAGYIISEPSLSLADKLGFFSSSIRDIFTTYGSVQAAGIAVFSVLFGINAVMLIFVLVNIGIKNIAKQSGASGAGLVVAVISGGCVACGTSLLAPIAATLGASSGAFLRDLSVYLNWLSSLLILYSIYKLGLLALTKTKIQNF